MNIIAKFEITETRPEEMRVGVTGIYDAAEKGTFVVQTFSKNTSSWITQKAHRNEKDAIMDCATWY